MSEVFKSTVQEFPTPAITQKAEAALAAYRDIKAGLAPQKEKDEKAFFTACGRGDLEVVRSAIEKGMDAKVRNSEALVVAAKNGHTEIVRLLLAHGAEVAARPVHKITINAAGNGHTEIVRLLIAQSEDHQNARYAAITSAAAGGKIETVRQLLEDGVDIGIRRRVLEQAAGSGHIEIVRLLIAQGMDVAEMGGSAIIMAASGGHTETIRLLIDHGANVKFQNNEAIITSAYRGHTETVRLLIEHGADVTVRDNNALIQAAQCGHTGIVRLLLEHGADAGAQNNMALQAAAHNGYTEIIGLLVEHGVDVTVPNNLSIMMASPGGHTETVRLLIKCGADVTSADNNALQGAARNGHTETIRLLLDQGERVRAGIGGALIVAVGSGQVGAIRLLIEEGADVKVSNNTALIIAAQNIHRPDVIRLLLDHGVDESVIPEFAQKSLAEYELYASRWRRILRRDPLPGLLTEDPALFKGTCYQSIRLMLNDEGYQDDDTVKRMAFRVAALFQSEERVLQYLKQWGGPGHQPLHNLVQGIRVPSVSPVGIKPNLKDWADGVLKCGPSMAKLVKFADKVPSPVKTEDGRTWSMLRTREACARFGFKRAGENIELATLCFEHDVSEKTFDKTLEILKDRQPVNKNIPDMMFDGGMFDMPGGKFRRLADGDIKGLFLGEMTDCCQSIGGAGEPCAEHGFTSKHGGFYVIENARGRVIGQSWAWRGKEGELCLDSLETLGRNVTGEQWLGIVDAFRAALSVSNDHKVTALAIGIGGATQQSCPGLTKKFTEATNAVPKDYKGYRDSHRQVLVWRAPHV